MNGGKGPRVLSLKGVEVVCLGDALFCYREFCKRESKLNSLKLVGAIEKKLYSV